MASLVIGRQANHIRFHRQFRLLFGPSTRRRLWFTGDLVAWPFNGPELLVAGWTLSFPDYGKRTSLSKHLFRSKSVHRSFWTRSRGAVLTGREMDCVYRSRRRGWRGRDCCTEVLHYWRSNADFGPRRCPATLEPGWPTDLLYSARSEAHGSQLRPSERKGGPAAYCIPHAHRCAQSFWL